LEEHILSNRTSEPNPLMRDLGKEISPLYFIMGPEVFLIRENLKAIRSRVISKEYIDFNYTVLRADAVEKLLEIVQTLPVFSERRLVICEEAHSLKEPDYNKLKPILENPIDTCVLVFVSEAPDKRKKVIKELMSLCKLIAANTPKESEWTTWLKWMGNKEGITFSNEASTLMRQYAGYELMHLEGEVKKIKHFLGSRKLVSEEDILQVVPRVRPENIFSLSKAIGQKKLPDALLYLAHLLEDNQNEVGALSLISRHVRILMRIKKGLKKGYTAQTLCKKTGVPSFFIRNYIEEAKLWTEKKLASTLEVLYMTDKAVKSSPVSSHIWLENCIIKVCSI